MSDFDPKTWDFYLAARNLIEADRGHEVGGPALPIPHDPCQGVYRMRTHKDGPFIPVQIWYGQDGSLKCKRNGVMVEETVALGIWTWCARNAITQDQLDGFLATKTWFDEVKVEAGGKTMSSHTPEPAKAKPSREKRRQNPEIEQPAAKPTNAVAAYVEEVRELFTGDAHAEESVLTALESATFHHELPAGYLVLDGTLFDDMGDEVTDPVMLRAAGLVKAEEPATLAEAETPAAQTVEAEDQADLELQPDTSNPPEEIIAPAGEAPRDRFYISVQGKMFTHQQEYRGDPGVFEISAQDFGDLVALNKGLRTKRAKEMALELQAKAAGKDAPDPAAERKEILDTALVAPEPQPEPAAATPLFDVEEEAPREEDPAPAGIGDNSGDEFVQLRDDVQEWTRVARKQIEKGTPKTKEEAAPLADTFTKLADFRKALREAKDVEKRPHIDANNAIEARYKPIIAEIDEVRDEIDGVLKPYFDAARAAEAQRVAAINAANEAAADTGGPARAAKARSVNVGNRRGVAVVKRKVVRVTDAPAAFAHFAAMEQIPPDLMDALRKVGKKVMDAGITVPGMELKEEESLR